MTTRPPKPPEPLKQQLEDENRELRLDVLRGQNQQLLLALFVLLLLLLLLVKRIVRNATRIEEIL